MVGTDFTGMVNKQMKNAQIVHILQGQGHLWVSRARRSTYHFYNIIILKIFLNHCFMLRQTWGWMKCFSLCRIQYSLWVSYGFDHLTYSSIQITETHFPLITLQSNIRFSICPRVFQGSQHASDNDFLLPFSNFSGRMMFSETWPYYEYVF